MVFSPLYFVHGVSKSEDAGRSVYGYPILYRVSTKLNSQTANGNIYAINVQDID